MTSSMQRVHTHPRADSDSRIYAAVPGRTTIGPPIQVHAVQFLGTHRIEIQIPSTTTPNRNSSVVVCRVKNRFVDELHLRDPGHNPTSSELFLERSIASLQSWSNPASWKLMRRGWKFRHTGCTIQKKLFLLDRGSGMTFLPTNLPKETVFQPKSQNWS